MSEPKLKHCPRCEDGESALKQVLQDVDLMVLRECRACGLRSPNFKTGAEADSWWNGRPAEQAKASCQGCDDPGFGCRECEQPEPTRNAAEPPLHQCTYGGCKVQDAPNGNGTMEIINCGDIGWLCDRCKEDRADARHEADRKSWGGILVDLYSAAHHTLHATPDAKPEYGLHLSSAARQRVVGVETSLAELRDRHDDLDNQVDDLAEVVHACRERIEALEARPSGPDHKHVGLENAIDKVLDDLENLDEQHDQRLSALESRLEGMGTRIEVDLVERIEALEQQIGELARAGTWGAEAGKLMTTAFGKLEARLDALESRLPGPQTPTQDLGTHSMEPLDEAAGTRHCDCDQCNDEPTRHGEARTCAQCVGCESDDDSVAPDCRMFRPREQPEARTCGNCGHGSRFTPGCSENWVTRCGAPLPMWAGQGNVNVLPDQDATHCADWTPKEAKA